MDFDDVEVAPVSDLRADLGEGPCWDDRSGTLLFVDISAGHIHHYDPDRRSLDTTLVGQEVGAAIPRVSGGLVVAMRDGVGIVRDGGDQVDLITPIERDDPANRMNDATCDPQGRLWAGTMAFDFEEGAASLYRIDADFAATRVLRDLTISNGMGWSPAGDSMYFIDSTTYAVDVFPFDGATGELGERERLISFSPEGGMPDGLTVDAEGGIWVAFFGGAVVRRFDTDGEAIGAIRLPVTQVTSACFGGASLEDLYITSAAVGLDAVALAQQPLAGATFVCRPGVSGLPTNMFAG